MHLISTVNLIIQLQKLFEPVVKSQAKVTSFLQATSCHDLMHIYR